MSAPELQTLNLKPHPAAGLCIPAHRPEACARGAIGYWMLVAGYLSYTKHHTSYNNLSHLSTCRLLAPAHHSLILHKNHSCIIGFIDGVSECYKFFIVACRKPPAVSFINAGHFYFSTIYSIGYIVFTKLVGNT